MTKTRISKENVLKDQSNNQNQNTRTKRRRERRKRQKIKKNLIELTNVSKDLPEITKYENETKVKQFEKNVQNEIRSGLKYIVIDGSNVAMGHGGKTFSAYGIKLAVEYFLKRGHTQITALVPSHRRHVLKDQIILDELESRGLLKYTPSRFCNGKLNIPYDDRFILELAEQKNAVIVSNDNYRDLKNEKSKWRQLVNNNLLQFVFVGDIFMVPEDPIGRFGPTLASFLSNN